MTNDLSQFFAPRWTWRSVLLAGAFSLGVYGLLPFLESLSAPPALGRTVRTVTTARLPPPPPAPPPRRRAPVAEAVSRTPRPELQENRRQLAPLRAALDLGMALGDLGGDFHVDFGLSDEALGEQVRQLVFEIGDLDEPPRPLARLMPLYPPQARMRRIEGRVVVEFVVSAEGNPRDLVVVSSEPGDVFTAAAVRAIERWRFAPGTRGREAVATRVRQKVEFRLE